MSSISLYCDSEAILSRVDSKVYNGKSRHISLRHEYVKQLITDGVINIIYVKSSNNLADLFTKALKFNIYSPFQYDQCKTAMFRRMRLYLLMRLNNILCVMYYVYSSMDMGRNLTYMNIDKFSPFCFRTCFGSKIYSVR